MTTQQTQEQTILAHLQAGKAITPAHSFMVYGISRLSSVIMRLRLAGVPIAMHMKVDEVGRKYGEYRLAPQKESPRIGSMVTIKRGHGWGLPSWIRRSKPARVVGVLDDVAYVEFTRGTRYATQPMNLKELEQCHA